MKPERNAGWRTIAAAVAMAMVAGLPGCSSQKTATPAQRPGTKTEHGTAGVDLLLVEALRQLIDHRDPAQALAMAELAVKRAPQRIDAAWLHLQICANAQGCQPEPLETRLRNLDPSNGAVWLGPLARARARGDQASEDQLLEALARSERIDLYWNSIVANLAAALADRTRNTTPANQTPLTSALNDTVGLVSKVAVPVFAPLADSCNARRLSDKLVSARCLLAAVALQRSDTYIAESMGLGIAQRLATVSSTDAATVEQRIATSRYQRETAGEVINGQVERERFATQLLDLMRKQRREQDVFIAVIRWAGQPLIPPPES